MKGQDILSKINHQSGMTVPEGYFEDFNARMIASLPQQDWERPEPRILHRSLWTRVRPYVYMAAMFMGIWCMMKTFDLMRGDVPVPMERNTELMSAINNDSFFNDYFTPSMSETDIYEDLYDEGFDPETLDTLN